MSVDSQIKLLGFDEWAAKMMSLPPAVLEAGKKTTKANADEWAAKLPTLIDDKTGALAGTVVESSEHDGLKITVSIGNEEVNYVLPYETGHFDHGKFVPGQHKIFPELKKQRKKAKRRTSAAVRYATKAIVGDMIKGSQAPDE